LYGGLVPISPDARVDDGLLDAVLFPGATSLDAAAHAARVLAGLHVADAHITLRRVRRLRVETIAEPLRECHARQLGHLSPAGLKTLTALLKTARAPHEPPGSPWA